MTDARHRVSREIIFVEVPSAGPQFERQGRPRPYPVNPRLTGRLSAAFSFGRIKGVPLFTAI
jgi:hypothetical protein